MAHPHRSESVHRTWRISRACALALALGACSSPREQAPQTPPLVLAQQRIESGALEEAARELDTLAGGRVRNSSIEESLYAAWLLVRVHERAADGHAFLEERAPRRSFHFEAETIERAPSPVSHVVAAAFQATRGRQLYTELQRTRSSAGATDDLSASAREAGVAPPTSVELPPSLPRLAPEEVLTSLTLSLLGVYSRLEFTERMEEIVDALPELTNVDTTRAWLETLQVEPSVRPWIYRAIFDYLTTRDEPRAYRFGVLAIEAARGRGTAFEAAADEIVHWIREESAYVYVSPAGQRYDPALPGCTVDGTPNVDFSAVPRESQ